MINYFEKLFSTIKDFLDFYSILISILLIIILVLSKIAFNLYRSKKNLNYYMDVIRTVSKGLCNNHEIVAFNNDSNNIIFTTHPQFYSNKEDFFNNLINKIAASVELKKFHSLIESKKTANFLLKGLETNLNNTLKKIAASHCVVNSQDSLLKSDVSIVTLTDISKHFTEAETKLKNYEDLEKFIDNLPIGIFYIDKKRTIIGSNTTFANFLNSTKERLIGVSINEFISSFDFNNDLFSSFVDIKVKPKFSPEFDARLIKANNPINSNNQQWILYKSAQSKSNQITKNNEFLDQEAFIFAQVPSIITSIDGEVKALNPAFASLIQDKITLDKNKIIKPGSNILNFIQEEENNKDIIERLKNPTLPDDTFPPIEIKFKGGKIVVIAYITIIKTKDKEKLVLMQMLDISSQKVLEQQFIQSQKMQAVGQLAGGIAHDFNNLLTAMIGFCDLLLQRYTQNDPSYGDVVQIKQNAARAANLVRQLLAFSRQQALKPKVMSVTEALVELSSLLKRLIGSNIEFQVIHGREIWPVKVDSSQFEQVIINLAVNARDAMHKGGKLTIKTKNHYADEEFKCIYDVATVGDYVLIEIIDTGSGIDSEIIENIFEPFFSKKGSDIKKKTGSGTGLGLSTVYGIIKQTGGFINVETSLGNGSNFQIFLPKYTGKDSIQAINNEINSRDLSGSETILLVEDEDSVRMFSARALRDKGYKVLEASSAEEALDISKIEKFDLLVTDVVMPKIDGPTLNKKLRESIKDLKTIFISGYTEDTFRQDLDKNLNIHFLQKPFTLKDLATKVKEVISQN